MIFQAIVEEQWSSAPRRLALKLQGAKHIIESGGELMQRSILLLVSGAISAIIGILLDCDVLVV